MQITDQHYEQLVEDGYLILPGFIAADELPPLQAAQRRVVKTWDEIKHNPPADGSALIPYPFDEILMTKPYFHPELLKLGRRFLGTDDMHVRVGFMVARYPGFKSGDPGHIDNGNNSLLPMTDSDQTYGQLGFWIHLDEVTADQAPLLLVKKKYGKDLSKAEPLVCPAGTIAVFNNYTFHASSPFKGSAGQRFTWGFGLGRADHYFESLINYTSHGQHPGFSKMIGTLTPAERLLFRFPPPGHAYYTAQTLAALEAQCLGWNSTGAYSV